jgi:hypothetical protein
MGDRHSFSMLFVVRGLRQEVFTGNPRKDTRNEPQGFD